MARINPSLTGKIETAFDAKIKAAYDRLTKTSACAGLRNAGEKYKNNYTLAQVAKINHYGAIVTRNERSWKIPPRNFISAATRADSDIAPYITNLRNAIVDEIKEAKPRQREPVPLSYDRSYIHDVQARPFGGTPGKHHGPQQIMQAIAAVMAENQRTAILKRDYPSGASHNSETTIEMKGFDFPLLKSGKLFTKIESWVEAKK